MFSIHGLLSSEYVRVESLRQIYITCSGRARFATHVLSAARVLDDEIAWRAYWLLLRSAREHRLNEAEICAIARSADEARHWVSRLALCQLFSATGIPEAARPAATRFLFDCFRDRRVIIRAWAITALATIRSDSRYVAEIEELIAAAGKDPGNAMQARLRAIGLAPQIRGRRARKRTGVRRRTRD